MTLKPLGERNYEQFARRYAKYAPKTPHNAYYERPATLSLLPDVEGKRVLDAGCGPGHYAAELLRRGADLVAVDVTPEMVEIARESVGNRATVVHSDLEQPLHFAADGEFDVVVCPLMLDYIADWRPALARLFEDIQAGKVQCVVVYKVDRLSRSLLDFTRLIDLFDTHEVAFVSITQQFQTTTSMGRLTLNVLLSFAQFEREMIAERTRDKMGAARRRGKWVGGFPILGYDLDPEGGRLHVNAEEAEQVQAIFKLYLRRRSLRRVLRELDQRGWRTKRWRTRKGRWRGGSRFSKSGLSHLLQHVYYVGQVRYRGETYKGEHGAVVDEKVFERVQRCLRRGAGGGRHRPKQPSGALLMGLLECGACRAPMTPYTAQKSRRYRYYLCTRAQREGRNVGAHEVVSRPQTAQLHPAVGTGARLSRSRPRRRCSRKRTRKPMRNVPLHGALPANNRSRRARAA